MKSILHFVIATSLLLTTAVSFSQDQEDFEDVAELYEAPKKNTNAVSYGDNGFTFKTFDTGINTKYSEYGIGFFKDKFISYSSKKIGALAKKDPATKEPYTKLFCSDITADYDLERSLLFSSVLNRSDNLGGVSFTNSGNTIYFTQSQDDNTQRFNLYRAEMNPERQGEWINITLLSVNGDFSVETPHISKDEKWLYFSSNRPEAIGGFDLFKVALKDNHIEGNVTRIEGSVNTVLDEKFPQTSLDGNYLYFSSKGHDSQGGFDIFRSRITTMGFVSTRNLGSSINSPKDELAFIQATPSIGYITSDRDGGKGGYDIYKIEESILELYITGKILDKETQIPLVNAVVVLLDEYGVEVATLKSNTDGSYKFPVEGFVNYTLLSYKSGFERSSASINTRSKTNKTFANDIYLQAEPAEIVETEEKAIIKIDNIQFDYNSAQIKDTSTITLNTVFATLKAHPGIRININAHTDAKGSAPYNKKLSKKRATAALDYLVRKGISKDRLISEGFGEEQLLISCNWCTPEQDALNRRVEFVIIRE